MTETTDEKPAPPEVWYWIEFLENEPGMGAQLAAVAAYRQQYGVKNV